MSTKNKCFTEQISKFGLFYHFAISQNKHPLKYYRYVFPDYTQFQNHLLKYRLC